MVWRVDGSRVYTLPIRNDEVYTKVRHMTQMDLSGCITFGADSTNCMFGVQEFPNRFAWVGKEFTHDDLANISLVEYSFANYLIWDGYRVGSFSSC